MTCSTCASPLSAATAACPACGMPQYAATSPAAMTIVPGGAAPPAVAPAPVHEPAAVAAAVTGAVPAEVPVPAQAPAYAPPPPPAVHAPAADPFAAPAAPQSWAVPTQPAPGGWAAPAAPTPWSTPYAPPAATGQPSMSAAWAMVAVPVLALPLGFLAGLLGAGLGGLLLVLVLVLAVHLGLCAVDVRRVRAAGYDVSTLVVVAAVLLTPLYLYLRAKRVGHPQTVTGAWLAVALLERILTSTVLGGGGGLPPAEVERLLEAELARETGQVGQAVCPRGAEDAVGVPFACTLTTPAAQLVVDVVVQDEKIVSLRVR